MTISAKSDIDTLVIYAEIEKSFYTWISMIKQKSKHDTNRKRSDNSVRRTNNKIVKEKDT